jgi:hypothetical protein
MYHNLQGRYIPLFASAVYDQNVVRIGAGLPPINLTSVMIGKLMILYTCECQRSLRLASTLGNGMTDPFKMILSYYDVQCTDASVDPFLDIFSCVRMKRMVRLKLSLNNLVDHMNH